MIWANIINNKIIQTHKDLTGLWNPNSITKNKITGYWEQVPAYVDVGWRFKNDQWEDESISIMSSQSLNCCIDFTSNTSPTSNTYEVQFISQVSRIYDTWSITIGDTTYSTAVTAANGITNEFTCTTTSWLKIDDQITFMDTLFGGVQPRKTYLIHSIISATKFKIYDPLTPTKLLKLTTATGTMTVSKGPDFQQIFQKTNIPQSVTVSICATGAIGTTTYTLENEMALIVPEIWVPLFA